ncbi:hypothetical protein SDC9_131640 [bioreactor metagenome]|uniref:Transmembrane protein n=1 Tax=bioreactor metagenome TaxID=1076179 RepID=A0A645D5T7_9ZZZZ
MKRQNKKVVKIYCILLTKFIIIFSIYFMFYSFKPNRFKGFRVTISLCLRNTIKNVRWVNLFRIQFQIFHHFLDKSSAIVAIKNSKTPFQTNKFQLVTIAKKEVQAKRVKGANLHCRSLLSRNGFDSLFHLSSCFIRKRYS